MNHNDLRHNEGKARSMNHMSDTGNKTGTADGSPKETIPKEATDRSPASAPSLTASSGQTWQVMRIKALRQGDDPAARSRTLARRLIDIVNLSDYLVMVRVTGHDGGLSMEVGICIDNDRFHDGASDAFAWRNDLGYVFDGVCEPDDRPMLPSLPMRIGDAYEMQLTIPTRKPAGDGDVNLVDPMGSAPVSAGLHTTEERLLDSIERDIARMPDGFTNASTTIFNVGHDRNPIPFYKRLANGPDTSVVFLLQKATPRERAASTEVYDPEGDFDTNTFYPNVPPVRFRMVVASPTRVDKGVLSELKALTFADITHLDKTEADRLRMPDSDTLRGYVVPGAIAGAYLRLPVAADGPFPGMATLPAEIKDHPLDPMPQPATDRPIRLGAATAGDGRTVDVRIEPTDLVTHMQVLGAPGSGKTTFLVNLGRELARQGIGFAFFSTHRDLMERILATASGPKGYALLGVDHADTEHVVNVNPLRAKDDDDFARRVSEVTDVLKDYLDPKNQGFFGERAASSLSLVANGWRTLLRRVPSSLSIPVVTSTLTRRDLCESLALMVRDVDMQLGRQIHEQMASMSDSDAGDLFSWLGSRFNVMHSSPLLMRILSTSRCFDLAGMMEDPDGGGLVVNLAGETLGTAAGQFLMACWLVEIKHAMMHRSHPERPFVVVVDEAHAAAFGPLAAMLDQARKFGVCVVIAHQRIGQLNPQLADALEEDAGSFISLRTGLRDADRASIRLGGWRQGDLLHMPTFEAAATLNRAGVPTEPFTLHVDPPHDMTESQRELLRKRLGTTWKAFGVKPTDPDEFVPTPTSITRLIKAMQQYNKEQAVN